MKEEYQEARTLTRRIISFRSSIKQFYFQKIKEHQLDLTYEMVQVLAVLWREDEVNQQDIAEAIQKNKASVTPLIDNLCKRDLVIRTPDPADRRNNRITLTKKGREYEKKILPIQTELHARMLDRLTVKEIKSTNETLAKLIEILE